MIRKMYEIKINVSEMFNADGAPVDISTMAHDPGDRPGIMKIGIEGEDIVDAIFALGSALPKKTVFEVLHARLEGTFEDAEQVKSGNLTLVDGDGVAVDIDSVISEAEAMTDDIEDSDTQDAV